MPCQNNILLSSFFSELNISRYKFCRFDKENALCLIGNYRLHTMIHCKTAAIESGGKTASESLVTPEGRLSQPSCRLQFENILRIVVAKVYKRGTTRRQKDTEDRAAGSSVSLQVQTFATQRVPSHVLGFTVTSKVRCFENFCLPYLHMNRRCYALYNCMLSYTVRNVLKFH